MKQLLYHYLKNKTAKNAGWLILGKLAQMALSLVVGLLTARYLGPSNYGMINYIAAYVAFFTSFCTLGINSIQVKELLDHPNEQGTVMGTTLGLRAASSFLSALAIVCIVSLVDRDEPVTIVIAILGSIGVVFHVFECFNFWFQSKLQSKITAIATFIAYLITSIYRIILLATKAHIYLWALATSVDYFVVAVVLLIAYKKQGGEKLRFSLKYGKSMLQKSYHFILSGLMVSIYGQTDKLMLKQMLGDSEIGYYSMATSLSNLWCFILSAIISSMIPSIIDAFQKEEKIFERRNKQLYAIVFYLSFFVSLIFTIAAPLIVHILYGEAYMPTVNPLRIITWYTAFSYLGVARDTWIVCRQCQRYLKYLYMAAALCNVLMNLFFIPLLGVSGAALASLITQILTIVFPLFIKEMRESTLWIMQAICLQGVFAPQTNGVKRRKK